MENCLFCKIAAKEISAQTIYEDDRALAFLDIRPRSLGHAMVIPKYHAPTLLELPDGEIGPLFAAVKKVIDLLMKKIKPDGITIGINQGRASGQEVDHLHVHLMPRWHGDGGGSVQSAVDNQPEEPVLDVAKKIKN